MNNLSVTPIKPVPMDVVWESAIATMHLVAKLRGICNMAAVPSKVIEDMREQLVLLKGNEFHETELYKNLSFCQEICDLMMNGCDLDHDNANKHDRIAMIDQLIESLRTMRRRMS